jgi:hypothetical protein
MNTPQDDNTPPVVDAEVVSQPTSDAGNAAQVLIDLENLIKNNISTLDSRKEELKKFREMMSSALTNDETYRLHEEEAKKAAKLKAATKAQIMKLPANAELNQKVQTLSADLKEMDEALSDYLREYQRMSGSNEIEDNDGEVREIVYQAKLVKRSSKFVKNQ